MPVVHHTAEYKQHRGAVVSGGRAAAGLTPVPVRDSRRAEMRANTFSALSAKGWMMVSRSWYSRKRCAASALCQSLETAAYQGFAPVWPEAFVMGVPQLVTRAARLQAPLQYIIRQRSSLNCRTCCNAGTTIYSSNWRWERDEQHYSQGIPHGICNGHQHSCLHVELFNLFPMRMPSILQDLQPASPQQQPGRWQMWQGQQYHWPGRGWW